MNSEMEFEIDFRDMLYRIMVQWKSILRGAITIAFILFMHRLVIGIIAEMNPETILKAHNKYEIELNDYEATGERLNTRITNYQDSSKQQQIYNEKSEWMKIDPLNKWVGQIVLYVDAKYQIDPSLSYQNTDPTTRILMAYSAYMNSGEFYTTVISQTKLVDEIRFLREILSRSADTSSSTITISCIGKTETDVTTILDVVKQLIFEKYETFRTTLSDHSIDFLTESLYTSIDLDMDQKQKANLLLVGEYANSIAELTNQLAEWERSPQPKAKFGIFYRIKQAVKYGIIGGVAGIFIMSIFYGAAYAISRTIKTENDWDVLGIAMLGNILREVPPKKSWFYENWIQKFAKKTKISRFVLEHIGRRNIESNQQTQDQLIINNLDEVLKERNLKKAVFVDVMNEEGAQTLIENIDKLNPDIPYILAGNVLTDPNAAPKIGKDDQVFLLAKRYATRIDDIQKVRTLLSAFGKTIIGAVVLEDIEQ